MTAERSFNPSPAACVQWEILLADALDGRLKPEDEAAFAEHKAACPACATLFEEARRGREWLEYLSPEPEVPAGLLDRILAQTGPGQMEGYGLMPDVGRLAPVPVASVLPWQRSGMMGQVRRFAEPRLLMTAAMAFFTIALTLNLTGVRLNSLSLASFGSSIRPEAVRSFMERRLNTASTPIIRYYDHLRFVSEVQARMREMRRAAEDQNQNEDNGNTQKPKNAVPGESKQNPGRKGGDFILGPPQQAGNPVPRPQGNRSDDFLESSFTIHPLALQGLPAHSGGSATAIRERSTRWTA